MALLLNESSRQRKKSEGVLFCCREDRERIISDDDLDKIKRFINERGFKIRYTSTVISKRIKKYKRKAELEKKLNEFKSTRLVVTDRLHAMIFAAITGTPCIAIDNISGKVKGVYSWIKHLVYISVIQSVDEIPDQCDCQEKCDPLARKKVIH